jgi:tetratricopeptide (TPR) repeat protein
MRQTWLGYLGLLLAAPALAAWREASTEHFIVYSDGPQKSLVEFTQQVDKFDQVLRRWTGYTGPTSPVKVRVYLVDNEDKVREMDTVHRHHLAGFYYPSLSGGLAVVSRVRAHESYELDGEATLRHEYAHHFMAQYFPLVYPTWYQEGFAELFASMVFDRDGSIKIGESATWRMSGLFDHNWIGTKQLMEATSPGGASATQSDVNAFYAQSWLLTHYLFDNAQRRTQMAQYFVMRNQGASHEEAMQRALGLSDQEFDQELRSYFSRQKILVKKLTLSGIVVPDVSVTELSLGAGDLLLADVRMEVGVVEQDRKQFLENVRERSAEFPDDDDAQLVLARAEMRYGDRDRARTLLEALVKKDPPNRRSLLELAILYETGRKPPAEALTDERAARPLAARANRLLTSDPEALYIFYLSFAHEPDGPTKNALAGLAQAYATLPQSFPLATSYVSELLRANSTAAAVGILRRLAYSPHGGSAVQWAQARLKDIADKDGARQTPGPTEK